MKRVETFILDKVDTTPKLKDIEECVRIAKENDCVVNLKWFMKYSGKYERYIEADDDPNEFYERNLPKIYGV